jgi:hypothetical protein
LPALGCDLKLTDRYSITLNILIEPLSHGYGWWLRLGGANRMKKFIVGVVVGFVVSLGVGFAAPSVDHNGLFWNRLNGSAKTGYINGYGDAMQVSVGKLDSLTFAAALFHWKGADKIIKQLSRELSISDVGADDAVKKLDALYANPKYGDLDLAQAMQLLAPRDQNLPAAAPETKPAKNH